jgi:DNA-binding MarR family transcriptional regulator
MAEALEMARSIHDQAGDLQRATAQLVKKFQFRDRNETVAYGLSVSQAYVLRALHECGALTMGELACEMRLSVSTMTRVVAQLDRKALVRRTTSDADGRVRRVGLTARGTAQWLRIEEELIAGDVEVLRTVPAAQRETLIRAIGQLSAAIDRWRESQQGGEA